MNLLWRRFFVTGATIRRALKLNSTIKNSFTMRICISIALSMQIKNYSRAIRFMADLPHITCAIASLKLKDIRKDVLKNFSIAYNNNSNLVVPFDFIKNVLAYDCCDHVRIDLVNLGILNENSSTTSVCFIRKKFDSNQSCVSFSIKIILFSLTRLNVWWFSFQYHFSSNFVESKLEDCHLPDLIMLRNIHQSVK